MADLARRPPPTVSVIIPTHNREQYVQDAICSVLAQTYGDFEIVVVDDGSTDSTAKAVRALDDGRIRLVQHARNRGIPSARNTGLDQARGKYIAWLDSDDIARPNRIEVQVRYLTDHPSVAMIGACAGKIGSKGERRLGTRTPPLRSPDIAAWLLFRSAFQQSSVMGRAEVLKACRYREEYPVCEDVDVFIRLNRSHRIENLPRLLVDRRIHGEQTIRVQEESIKAHEMTLLREALAGLGVACPDEDLRRHTYLAAGGWGGARPDRAFLEWSDAWLRGLRDANTRSRCVDPDSLRLATSLFWLRTCAGAIPTLGVIPCVQIFARSPLASALASAHALTWLSQAVSLQLLGAADYLLGLVARVPAKRERVGTSARPALRRR